MPLCDSGYVHDELSGDARTVSAVLFDLGGVVIELDFNGAFALWAARVGCDLTMIAERFSLEGLRATRAR